MSKSAAKNKKKREAKARAKQEQEAIGEEQVCMAVFLFLNLCNDECTVVGKMTFTVIILILNSFLNIFSVSGAVFRSL